MLTRYRSVVLILLVALACITMFWHANVRVGLVSQAELHATEVIRNQKGDPFPLTLLDPVGESYRLITPPQRIVSATLATDEILSALVDLERIAGVTHLVDDPNISNVPYFYPDTIQRIKGEVEEILSLEPDLVFVSAYSRAETVRLLLGAGVPVVRLTEFNSLEDIQNNIQLVAEITGKQKKGRALLMAIQHKLGKTRSALVDKHRPRVLYYSLDGSSVGLGSTIDEMIHLAGGYNVVRETGLEGISYVSEEMLIALQPELILVSGWVQQGLTPAQYLAQKTAWQHVPAVVEDKIFTLQGAWLSAVSQYSWEGVEQMAALLHPDALQTNIAPVKDVLRADN